MFGFDNSKNRCSNRLRDSDWLGGSNDRDDDELEAELRPSVVQGQPVIETEAVDDSTQQVLRIKADFDNYKRRVQNERQQQVECANKELILKLLPVLDDFNYALDSVPQDVAQAEWLKGITLIKDKLTLILEKEGVTKIDVEGKAFDPRQHEAIYCDENADDDECVVKEVIKNGYKLNDEIIRPAQVIVSS